MAFTDPKMSDQQKKTVDAQERAVEFAQKMVEGQERANELSKEIVEGIKLINEALDAMPELMFEVITKALEELLDA